MSRATLCTLLGELGYEGADALDPDSFEWPFQYDDARPIHDWICSSLRPSNVLSLAMNAVLGRMASTAQELAHYHSGDGDGIHLAYSDFHPYLIGDSSCIKELNQWFAKQLDTGPFRLVVEEGKSKCSWVSLEDISNIIVRADLEKSHHQRV